MAVKKQYDHIKGKWPRNDREMTVKRDIVKFTAPADPEVPRNQVVCGINLKQTRLEWKRPKP